MARPRDPLAELADLAGWARQYRDALEANTRLVREQVIRARRAGLSWAKIGHALGVTAQAAQQRYGRITRPDGTRVTVDTTADAPITTKPVANAAKKSRKSRRKR